MSSDNSEVSEEFIKIVNDFTNDLKISYPELSENFETIDYQAYYNYCKNIYPENFFNVLYENEDLFKNDETKYLLPNINFETIMCDESLSAQSKKTIWKYLQLLLFCICNNVNNKKDFGEANYLFEAINEDELHSKIQETMKEMKNIFLNMNNEDNSNNPFDEFTNVFSDISDLENMFEGDNSENVFSGLSGEPNLGEGMFENMMDADKMKEHLSGIMNGKIGSLAKEIAEEATKELGLEGENMDENSQHEFMKNLFKNPTKILSIVKNIGSKLEEKFKSGEMKESELLEEAQEIMSKMKDMPGLKNMMSSMGLNPGGKFDFKSMASKMQQNMRSAKMKERMQAKLQKNRQQQQQQKNEPVGNLQQVEENTFVWNDDNSNPNQPFNKSASSASSKPKKSNKKKNKKKNKNKN